MKKINLTIGQIAVVTKKKHPMSGDLVYVTEVHPAPEGSSGKTTYRVELAGSTFNAFFTGEELSIEQSDLEEAARHLGQGLGEQENNPKQLARTPEQSIDLHIKRLFPLDGRYAELAALVRAEYMEVYKMMAALHADPRSKGADPT